MSVNTHMYNWTREQSSYMPGYVEPPIQGHKYGYDKPPPQPLPSKPRSNYSDKRINERALLQRAKVDRVLSGFLVSIGDLLDYIDNSSELLFSCANINVELAFQTIFNSLGDKEDFKFDNYGQSRPIIHAEDLMEFLSQQKFQVERQGVDLLIGLFDSAKNRGLDFDDFECLLVRDNAKALLSKYSEYLSNRLTHQEEYLLARYFYCITRHLESLVASSEYTRISQEMNCCQQKLNLFNLVSEKCSRNRDQRLVKFQGLKSFLQKNMMNLEDNKLVSILRAIDIECVGEINQDVWNNFFNELRQHSAHSRLVKNSRTYENFGGTTYRRSNRNSVRSIGSRGSNGRQPPIGHKYNKSDNSFQHHAPQAPPQPYSGSSYSRDSKNAVVRKSIKGHFELTSKQSSMENGESRKCETSYRETLKEVEFSKTYNFEKHSLKIEERKPLFSPEARTIVRETDFKDSTKSPTFNSKATKKNTAKTVEFKQEKQEKNSVFENRRVSKDPKSGLVHAKSAETTKNFGYSSQPKNVPASEKDLAFEIFDTLGMDGKKKQLKKKVQPPKEIQEILRRQIQPKNYNFGAPGNCTGRKSHENLFNSSDNNFGYQAEKSDIPQFSQTLEPKMFKKGIFRKENSPPEDNQQFSSPPARNKKTSPNFIRGREEEQIKNTPDPNQHQKDLTHDDLVSSTYKKHPFSNSKDVIQPKDYESGSQAANQKEQKEANSLHLPPSEKDTSKFGELENRNGQDAHVVSFNLQNEMNETMYTLEMRDSINPSFGQKSEKSQSLGYNSHKMEGLLRKSRFLVSSSCTNLLKASQNSYISNKGKENCNEFNYKTEATRRSKSNKALIPKLKMSQIIEEKTAQDPYSQRISKKAGSNSQIFEEDTKDTERMGKELRASPSELDTQPQSSGFVIDFSKKNEPQNLHNSNSLMKSSYISAEIQNITIEHESLHLDPPSSPRENNKILKKYCSSLNQFQQPKNMKASHQIGIENSSQKTRKMNPLNPNLHCNQLKIVEAFNRIITLEKQLEEYKQELVLCSDFNLRDLFAVLCKLPQDNLCLKDLQQLIHKLKLQSVLSEKDLRQIVRRYGSSGRGKLKKISLKDFTQMINPLQKEYQILLSCRSEYSSSEQNDEPEIENLELEDVTFLTSIFKFTKFLDFIH